MSSNPVHICLPRTCARLFGPRIRPWGKGTKSAAEEEKGEGAGRKRRGEEGKKGKEEGEEEERERGGARRGEGKRRGKRAFRRNRGTEEERSAGL